MARHGKCLDASQRNKTGGKVHMWHCNTKNKNQMWHMYTKTVKKAKKTSSSYKKKAKKALACKIERNVDYQGGDLRQVHNVASVQACAAICGRTRGCSGVAYGRAKGKW